MTTPTIKLNAEQEIVSDGSLFITRVEVPNGWVYSSFDKSSQILESCFIPSSKAHQSEVDAARDDGIDKCIRHCREHGYFKVADSLEHLKEKAK